MPSAQVEVFAVQHRRRFSAEEKQRLVQESLQPGMTISLVARQHKLSPSLLFRWRKLSSEGALNAVGADEEVVPASEVKALYQQIRELQRLLGKKTQEAEILRVSCGKPLRLPGKKSGSCAHRDPRWATSGGPGLSNLEGLAKQCSAEARSADAARASWPPAGQ